MMPQDAHKKIKKIQIYHGTHISGFKFFDKKQALIFEIGSTHLSLSVTEVVLENNEQIIGVAFKLYNSFKSVFTDFQF